MAKELPGARERAEAKFDRAQKTTDEAKGVVDTELQATRKKTARLRQERLAKEAAEGVSDLDKKPGKKATGGAGREGEGSTHDGPD